MQGMHPCVAKSCMWDWSKHPLLTSGITRRPGRCSVEYQTLGETRLDHTNKDQQRMVAGLYGQGP